MKIEELNEHPLRLLAKKISVEVIYLFDECIAEFDSAKFIKQKVYELAIEFYNSILLGFTTYNSKIFESKIFDNDILMANLKKSKSLLIQIFGCIEIAKEEGIKFQNNGPSLSYIIELMDEYEGLLTKYEL